MNHSVDAGGGRYVGRKAYGQIGIEDRDVGQDDRRRHATLLVATDRDNGNRGDLRSCSGRGGNRTMGSRGPFAFPTPQAPSSGSPEPQSNATTLATSSEEPPPKPITPETLSALAAPAAAITVARDGSASTPSNTMVSMPETIRDARAGSQRPSFRNPGSVTKRIRRRASALRDHQSQLQRQVERRPVRSY
ncbi:Hypothetical protein NGAL_HAMBI2566_31990 [Neorhizobium galegae bv. orientalis]|nr:Hypothetical protein NGAL_HAMBI2566_31990 [Neorhizobium galegae bv. orientalis]